MRLYEEPCNYDITDILAFLKCMSIVFVQRRQYSVDLVNAFLKRMSLVTMHFKGLPLCGILYIIKQILTKYPGARSAMLDWEDEGTSIAFGNSSGSIFGGLYRADINDP